MTRLPLMIDVHCHTRDLKQRRKGTFETETRALLASGFGTAITMPDTDPPLLSLSDLLSAREEAAGRIYCDLGFHFGTNGHNTTKFAEVEGLVRGLKVYLNQTTGNLQLSDLSQVARVFKAWDNGKPVLVHAEGGSTLNTVMDLAKGFQRRLHICHVSLEEEVWIIRKSKREGVNVTAEVCPHHCMFSGNDLPRLGSYGIMKPPLGTPRDIEALWEGIKDGTIDVVATDHAPHTPEEKASSNPPFGVICEPAFSVMWMLCSQQGVSLEHLVHLMHHNPARIFNIRQDNESYMEVALADEFIFGREMIQSKAGRSPYEGMKVKGRIRGIVLHGTEVLRDGELLAKKGTLI